MTAISGEIIWITGASSGIGRAMAVQLAEQGNQVIASARGQAALDELVAINSNITACVFDVSDTGSCDAVRQQLLQIHPYLDRVIINAGTCEYLNSKQPDWAMMRRVMEVNYFGAINTLDVALPLLQAQPQSNAHIVGVVSMAAFVPFSRAEAYGSSKAALQYFLDSLRVDLAPEGIDVTVVNPGFVKTPLTDKNDFEMPFLVPVDKAASRIVAAIANRPYQYDFPRRLKWLLKSLGFFPGIWNTVVAPKLRA